MLSKPNYAKQKRKRKADKHRKDVEFQSESGYTCQVCGAYGKTVKHHLKGRRFQETRWDNDNVLELCVQCHLLAHSQSDAKFNQYIQRKRNTN